MDVAGTLGAVRRWWIRARSTASRRGWSWPDAVEATALAELDVWPGRFRRMWAPRLEALATEVARGRRARKRDVSR